jgi:hypothetical protein
MRENFSLEELRDRDQMEYLDVDLRITLRYILKEYGVKLQTGFT